MTLPQPGPGRPHHPSYTEPGPLISLRDLLVVILVAAILSGLTILVEVVVG